MLAGQREVLQKKINQGKGWRVVFYRVRREGHCCKLMLEQRPEEMNSLSRWLSEKGFQA